MAADDRVLGDGDFVEQIWSESAKREKETLRRKRPGLDLETLARDLVVDQVITETELRSGSRKRKVSEARRAFCRSSVGELGSRGGCGPVPRGDHLGGGAGRPSRIKT